MIHEQALLFFFFLSFKLSIQLGHFAGWVTLESHLTELFFLFFIFSTSLGDKKANTCLSSLLVGKAWDC